MACLMSRNAHSRHAVIVINAVRQADNVGARVIMVGKLAVYMLDADIGKSVPVQNGSGSVRSSVSSAVPHSAVF